MRNKSFYILLILLSGFSCKQNSQQATVQATNEHISVPSFNADSAYLYTAEQVAFGPRIPNTPTHKDCGNYLAGKLREFGAEVFEQETTLFLQDNFPIEIKNIIGSFQPENKNRILLFAHWDSRPYADHDPNPENWRKPIDGANDGAGACGVLLEIARQIGMENPKVGIDIILFDAEDWGKPNFPTNDKHHGDWCMGSEYWAKNPHIPNYSARFGILLDMVSAPDAQFYKEEASMYYAPNFVQKVWAAAKTAGFSHLFINRPGGQIMDDHIPVNQYRRIPSLDIIQQDPGTPTGFGSYWHTLEDNMTNVSKETMLGVGQTILQVLYNE